MTYTIPARPTIYRGTAMRSRLEALYAWWLDNVLELDHWQYEPQAYAGTTNQYLPDFTYPAPHIPGHTVYVDVKPPTADHAGTLKRMHVILQSDPAAILVVAVNRGGHGTWPHHEPSFHPSPATCSTDHPCGRCGRPQNSIWD